MNHLLRNTRPMALLGLAFGAFHLCATLVGVMVFAEEPQWGTALLVAALLPLLCTAGGLLHGVILGALARRGTQPRRAVRVLAAAVAGGLAGVLPALPYLRTEVRLGMVSHAGLLLTSVAAGALAGALVGTVAGIAGLWREAPGARVSSSPRRSRAAAR